MLSYANRLLAVVLCLTDRYQSLCQTLQKVKKRISQAIPLKNLYENNKKKSEEINDYMQFINLFI